MAKINALEPAIRALTDAELAEQTLRFKAALERNRHRWDPQADWGAAAAAADVATAAAVIVAAGRPLACMVSCLMGSEAVAAAALLVPACAQARGFAPAWVMTAPVLYLQQLGSPIAVDVGAD